MGAQTLASWQGPVTGVSSGVCFVTTKPVAHRLTTKAFPAAAWLEFRRL